MLEDINKFLGVITPVMLLCAGVFYLFRLKFFFIRHPCRMLCEAVKKEERGAVPPMRALCLALAGTLGVGNIVGVASCIKLGGYGAVFWMWVSALISMVLKFSEIVLSLLYRRVGEDGEYHGGAYFYIRDFFRKKGLLKLGSTAGAVFALLCVANSASMGSIVQANAVSSAFYGRLGVPLWLSGGVLCAASLFIILGNSRRISGFTEKIVCVMSVGFFIVSLWTLCVYRERIFPSLRLIFSDALRVESVGFGVLGFVFSSGFRMGCMRGLMSNEAGCGTAPTAHASSSTKSPCKQGLFGIIEVLVDTIVLCSMTALVIIAAGEGVLSHENPMMITMSAYCTLLGDWAGVFVCVAVLLFGFATVVCWAHYGREALMFVFRSEKICRGFPFVYAALVFFGSVCSAELAWQIADLALGLMTVMNVTVLCFMSGEVKREVEEFAENDG